MRSRAIRLGPLTAVAVALAFTLGGCGSSSGPAADGPLSSGNGIHDPIPRGSVCAPGGHPWAFAMQQFTNYGHTTVVLDSVVLLNPHNEYLVGSYAMPGDRIIGTIFWLPHNPDLPPMWKNRQAVHGFRLAPGKSFNMVLGVAATTPARATSQGILVYYHDSSGSFVAKNYWANIIAAASRKRGCR